MVQIKKSNLDKIINELNPSCITLLTGTDGIDGFTVTILSREIFNNRSIGIVSDRTEFDVLKKRLSEMLASIAFDEFISENINKEEMTRYVHEKNEIVQKLAAIKKGDNLEGKELKAICESLAKSDTTEIILLDLNIFQREHGAVGRFRENLPIIKKIAQKYQKHFLITVHGPTMGSDFWLMKAMAMAIDNVQILRLNYRFSLFDLGYLGGLQDGTSRTIFCDHREIFYNEEKE